MAQAAPFLLVASTALQAYGMYSEYKAEEKSQKVNRRLAEFNVGVLERKADDAIKRGQWSETQYRKQAEQLKGSQRAAMAASGIRVNEADSTAEVIQQDTERLSEMDALQIRQNAFNEAMGYKVQAANVEMGADLNQMASENRQKQTLISGAGSALALAQGFM